MTLLLAGLPIFETAPAYAQATIGSAVELTLELELPPGDAIVQRNASGTATISVSGTYRGPPSAIEAAVIDAESDRQVTPWVRIDDAMPSGPFSGQIQSVPSGGWFRVRVRGAASPAKEVTSVQKFGVGVLVACAGQSQIAIWFSTNRAWALPEGMGSSAHPLTRMYRHDGFRGSEPLPGGWHAVRGVGATAFANELHARLEVPIGLLHYGVSGAALLQENSLGGIRPTEVRRPAFGWWIGPQTDFNQLVRMEEGLASVGQIGAVLWVQGHTDALRDVDELDYARALRQLFSRFRRRNEGALPIFVSLLPRQSRELPESLLVPTTGALAVRAAQADVAATDPHTYLAATTIDLPLSPDQVHFSARGQETLAMRLAAAVAAVLRNSSSAEFRGPRLDRFEAVDERHIDVHIEHRGGADLTPLDHIRGFEVLHDDIYIKSARRLDRDTIRLELSGDARSVGAVSYLREPNPGGLDLQAYGSAFVHDDSEFELPLEAGVLWRDGLPHEPGQVSFTNLVPTKEREQLAELNQQIDAARAELHRDRPELLEQQREWERSVRDQSAGHPWSLVENPKATGSAGVDVEQAEVVSRFTADEPVDFVVEVPLADAQATGLRIDIGRMSPAAADGKQSYATVVSLAALAIRDEDGTETPVEIGAVSTDNSARVEVPFPEVGLRANYKIGTSVTYPFDAPVEGTTLLLTIRHLWGAEARLGFHVTTNREPMSRAFSAAIDLEPEARTRVAEKTVADMFRARSHHYSEARRTLANAIQARDTFEHMGEATLRAR